MRLASLCRVGSCAVTLVLAASAAPILAASGHVVDPGGKPVAGARACLLVGGADGLCSVTDAAGYYGLPDSSVPWVRITAAGFLAKQVSSVDQEAPIALDRAASLRVRLVDRATGAAIPKGEVFLIDSAGQKRGPLPTNAAGVQVSTLQPGEVVVQGNAPGHQDARSQAVRLQAGEETEVVLKLDPSGS